MLLETTTEKKTSKFTPRPSSSLSLSPNFQLLSAHMWSLKQKTENSDRNQHKSSLENANSSPSESVFHTLGKNTTQELHDELILCTVQIHSKVSIQVSTSLMKIQGTD